MMQAQIACVIWTLGLRAVERVAAFGLDLSLVMGSSEVHATPSAAPPQPRPVNHPAGLDPEAASAAPSHHSNAPIRHRKPVNSEQDSCSIIPLFDVLLALLFYLASPREPPLARRTSFSGCLSGGRYAALRHDITCGGRPALKRLNSDRPHFYGEGRFFERLISLRTGRHLARFLKGTRCARIPAAAVRRDFLLHDVGPWVGRMSSLSSPRHISDSIGPLDTIEV